MYMYIPHLVATATIYFSLAGVRLLIEGGSCSRAAFINFGVIPLDDIDTIGSFLRTDWGEPERAPHKRYSCARIIIIMVHRSI